MDLATEVLTYYFTHAGELPAEKRFHLANRLAVWNGDERARALLAECRGHVVPEPLDEQRLEEGFAHAAAAAGAGAGHIVAYELRKPYFDKYPALLGLEAELFRLRHLQTLYGVDALPVFLKLHDTAELRQLEQALLADAPALRALSTWAVNYIYLLHQFVLKDSAVDAHLFYSLGDGYNTEDEEQLRLLIYLYTHCIIADSDFYARPVPEANLPAYRQMLERLEGLLASRLEKTSLDTKLEFLVCCRLAGRKSSLETEIYDECRRSVSPEGTFLVDTHNVFKDNEHKKSFEASEHRNVLFALSVLPR
jgi:hypothetical protein